MQEPYAIASLPRPLDALHGRSYAAPVFNLSGSRKRKRHEVVVGVDGESVNIYNVQTQNKVGTYPIPPQIYLATKPCSVFFQGDKSIRPQRQTVLVVSDDRKAQHSRLLIFAEDKFTKAEKAKGVPPPRKRERRLRKGRVVGIDILPFRGNGDGTTLTTATIVSYENGDVDCISNDSLEPVWEYSYTEQEEEPVEVRYSVTVDVETASKGILKHRQDVSAALGVFTAGKGNIGTTWLLCQVVNTRDGAELRASSLKLHTPLLGHIKRSVVHELFTCNIPINSEPEGRYELDIASGLLYRLVSGRLKIIDVSKVLPEAVYNFSQSDTDNAVNFIQLTQHSVLLLSQRKAMIWESKFGSILSSSPFSSWSSNKERDGSNDEKAGKQGRKYLECVSSIPSLGLVVALAGDELVALQLEQGVHDGRQIQLRDPHLSSAVGKKREQDAAFVKGDGSKDKKQKHQPQHPLRWEDKVDPLLGLEDIKGLERLIAMEFSLSAAQTRVMGNGAISNTPNGNVAIIQDLWSLDHLSPINDPSKMMYILGKTFRWTQKEDANDSDHVCLEALISSRNIIRLLASYGMLVPTTIQLALSKPDHSLDRQPRLAPEHIIAALGHLDPSLSLVKDALSTMSHSNVSSDIEGIKLLMKALAPYVQENIAFSSIAEGDGHVAPQGHGNSLIDTNGVGNELSRNTDIRLHLAEMRPCLARLSCFAQSDLIQSMRSLMTNDEILFLVGILRLMLTDAGWTSRYIDADPNVSADDLDICNITLLLSAAVDAIGTVGWVVGGSSNVKMTEDLVSCLRAEVSAALEGCYEASTLSTLLSELLRCECAPINSGKRKAGPGLKPEVECGLTVLPLGSTIKIPIVEDRSLWEGKRKQRPVERRSKFVGKYSFERLRL